MNTFICGFICGFVFCCIIVLVLIAYSFNLFWFQKGPRNLKLMAIAMLLFLALPTHAGNVARTNAAPSTATSIGRVTCDRGFVLTQVPVDAVIVGAVDQGARRPGQMVLIYHQPSATNYAVQTQLGTNAQRAVVWKRADHQ